MKHRHIWDTLLTSEMEFFVKIGIYKVIFYRLMILYTVFLYECLYLCQFVTGSIPSQVGPSSNGVFVTITIANVVFYWAMVSHVQFLSMNFIFVSLQVVPARSRWFQLVLGSSSLFQVVPACSFFWYVRK